MNLISSNAIISDPHIFVPDHYWCPLLGESLREAGLISQAQLNTALRDKKEYRGQRIGEILALRGWLKQETVDFFAEKWRNYLRQGAKYPIGEYLKQAALLSELEIQQILNQQKYLNLKFGEIAVSQGLLKQQTVDFFLHNLLASAQTVALFVA